MDVLFPVRESEINEQLRFALRSLKNFPHGKVYISGYKPSWVKNVQHIKLTPQGETRFEKANLNIYKACQSDISQRFVLMYDDIYITKPIDEIPLLNRGDIDDVLKLYGNRQSIWLDTMRRTKTFLESQNMNTLSFEMHAPIVMDKDKYLETYDFMTRNRIPHGSTRTVYGNMHGLEGEKSADVKVYDWKYPMPNKPFFSTTHRVFPMIKPLLLKLFPEPCEYEV